MKRLSTLGLIALISITACRAKQYSPEAYQALASLRKIQAATQIGVNYQQYGQLLIEAKDKTNAASRVLSDGPVKTEIRATMDAYADAGQVWGEKTRSRDSRLYGWLNNDEEPGLTLIPKYSLKTDQYGNITDEQGLSNALKTIWLNADLHLTKLADLLPENRN
jgi:hypothetical protein